MCALLKTAWLCSFLLTLKSLQTRGQRDVDFSVAMVYPKNETGGLYSLTCVASGEDSRNASLSLHSLSNDVDYENLLFVRSKHLREIDNPRIDCRFDGNLCNYGAEGWSLSNGVVNPLEMLTDIRWEGLQIIKTTNNHQITFVKVTENYNIPMHISVLTELEAQIVITLSPTTTLWFIIDGWNGAKSALKICSEKEVLNFINLSKNGIFPEERGNASCGNLAEHAQQKKNLSRRIWNHFTIEIKDVISLYKRGSVQAMLSYNRPQGTFTVSKVGLVTFSKNPQNQVGSYWKIHNYNYMTTKQIQYGIINSIPLPSIRGRYCIQMFVNMCSKCQLSVALIANGGKIIERTNKTGNPNLKWQQIILDGELEGYYNVNVSTISMERKTDEQFWAIDDIKACDTRQPNQRISHAYVNKWIGNEQVSCEIIRNQPSTPINIMNASTATVVSLANDILDCILYDNVIHWRLASQRFYSEELYEIKFTQILKSMETLPSTTKYFNTSGSDSNHPTNRKFVIPLDSFSPSTQYQLTLTKIKNDVKQSEVNVMNLLIVPPPKVTFTSEGSISSQNETLVINMPSVENISPNSAVYIYIANMKKKKTEESSDVREVPNNLLNERYDHEMVQKITRKLSKMDVTFPPTNITVESWHLEALEDLGMDGNYLVTIIFENEFESKTSYNSQELLYGYSASHKFYYLLLLLLMIPILLIAIITVRIRNRKHHWHCIEEISGIRGLQRANKQSKELDEEEEDYYLTPVSDATNQCGGSAPNESTIVMNPQGGNHYVVHVPKKVDAVNDDDIESYRYTDEDPIYNNFKQPKSSKSIIAEHTNEDQQTPEDVIYKNPVSSDNSHREEYPYDEYENYQQRQSAEPIEDEYEGNEPQHMYEDVVYGNVQDYKCSSDIRTTAKQPIGAQKGYLYDENIYGNVSTLEQDYNDRDEPIYGNL